MKRRVLTFMLAVLLAVVGTAGVLGYVRGADNRALAGIQATTRLVAVASIPAGTQAAKALRDGMLREERFPMSSVPADALAVIPPDKAVLVTSAAMAPGQLLLRTMLVPGSAVGGEQVIPPGKFKLTMEFCLTEAIGGDVQAGTWVAVFNTVNPHGTVSGQSGCSLQQQQQLGAQAKVVIPAVQIWSVGPASSQSRQSGAVGPTQSVAGSSGSGAVLLTFVVDLAQAQQLVTIAQTGVPYLAQVAAPATGVTTSDPSGSGH